MRYSQNEEQEIIGRYFGGRPGTFLDIGANDGETFSNTRNLALHGWPGVCVEPSPSAFAKLAKLYQGNDRVKCFQYAIGSHAANNTTMMLHEGSDTLVSSLDPSRLGLWEGIGMTFDQTPVKVVNVIQLLDDSPYKTFDMVSIDAEGLDWAILRQMPLSLMGTKLIVIEYGEHGDQILDYCYDFKVLMRNGENLILAK